MPSKKRPSLLLVGWWISWCPYNKRMRYDCPYCGISLKGKLIRQVPAPNERRFLPSRAIPICCACKGMLQYNTHLTETFSLVMGLSFIISWLFFKETLIRSTLGLAAITVSLLVWLAAEIYLHIKHRKHWQRYKKYESSHAS